MRFGIWNVWSLYRAGLLTAATRKFDRYRLDIVGVQEVMLHKVDTVTAGNYKFFYGKENKNRQLGRGFLYTIE
jgi:hypothetical protein